MAPLQEFADRIAHRAMPAVHDTPEYQNFRQLQIYGAAIEDIVRAGPIVGAQRVALDRLREELGLPADEAATWKPKSPECRREMTVRS